jgi:flagellin-like protein
MLWIDMKMKIRKSNEAVSEVVGTVLLLGMTVSLFSLLSFTVLSYPFNPSPPSVNLIGYMGGTNDATDVIIEHYGGDSLGITTSKVIVNINGTSTDVNITKFLNDSNNNALWDLGEMLVYPVGDVAGKQVEVTVVDTKSNSVIMRGIIQGEDTL